MSSRIAQLALIDCLFAGVAQRSYEQAIDSLDGAYAVLQPRQTSGADPFVWLIRQGSMWRGVAADCSGAG